MRRAVVATLTVLAAVQAGAREAMLDRSFGDAGATIVSVATGGGSLLRRRASVRRALLLAGGSEIRNPTGLQEYDATMVWLRSDGRPDWMAHRLLPPWGPGRR